MEIVILLVPLGLVLAGLAVAAFMWGLRRGQFENLESRGWEVVFDDQAERDDPNAPGNRPYPNRDTVDESTARSDPEIQRGSSLPQAGERSGHSNGGGRR